MKRALVRNVAVLAAGFALLVVALRAEIGITQQVELPASNEEAAARLDASPRHGEWVRYDAGQGDSVLAWVVYPERSDPAPVVIVIHEIFGLTDWIRAVTDQLAAEGFVAIAPDLLTGKAPDGGGTASFDRDGAVRAIRSLDRGEVVTRLDGAARYATGLPAARDEFAAMGFCWGGSTTFHYATQQPELDGAIVYYGTSPETELLSGVETPVLGLYGGDDARVNRTIEPAADAMERLGKRYEYEIYDGAGHGFLRAQEGRDGANMTATRQAWARTISFLESALGG